MNFVKVKNGKKGKWKRNKNDNKTKPNHTKPNERMNRKKSGWEYRVWLSERETNRKEKYECEIGFIMVYNTM